MAPKRAASGKPLGSARIEVVRFFGCVGLTKILAPGRDTYGSVWSAAFQPCKKRAKILKWRQMRAFSNYVSEWCGRAVAARLLRGSCPIPARRPVPARFLPGSCPFPARFLPGSCPTAGQEPPRSGGSCAGAGQQPPHHSRVLHHPCANAS